MLVLFAKCSLGALAVELDAADGLKPPRLAASQQPQQLATGHRV